jgi:hypothetical protein
LHSFLFSYFLLFIMVLHLLNHLDLCMCRRFWLFDISLVILHYDHLVNKIICIWKQFQLCGVSNIIFYEHIFHTHHYVLVHLISQQLLLMLCSYGHYSSGGIEWFVPVAWRRRRMHRKFNLWHECIPEYGPEIMKDCVFNHVYNMNWISSYQPSEYIF